jgi:hypothetical protein
MSTAYGALAAPVQSDDTQGRLNTALPLRCKLKKTGLPVELDHLKDGYVAVCMKLCSFVRKRLFDPYHRRYH